MAFLVQGERHLGRTLRVSVPRALSFDIGSDSMYPLCHCTPTRLIGSRRSIEWRVPARGTPVFFQHPLPLTRESPSTVSPHIAVADPLMPV